MLVLPVGFSVVACHSVCKSGRSRLLPGTWDLPPQSIVEPAEQPQPQTHVPNWIDPLPLIQHTPGHLPKPMAPVMLYPLQVPLVHQHHDPLMLTPLDRLEDVLIPPVHTNLLQLREKDLHAPHIPVHQVLVQTLLSKCSRASVSYLLLIHDVLILVKCISILESLVKVVREIHSGLMVQPVCSHRVKLIPQKVYLSSQFLCLFTSKFNL